MMRASRFVMTLRNGATRGMTQRLTRAKRKHAHRTISACSADCEVMSEMRSTGTQPFDLDVLVDSVDGII